MYLYASCHLRICTHSAAMYREGACEEEKLLYIVLGLPGCAQVFPYLSPGTLDFLVVCKNE